ncbi:chaperonin 10-like protein [Hyaloraphidium curvatum]|nr:chaperonin 10-like protein [Hyaloraphidium curvatum]
MPSDPPADATMRAVVARAALDYKVERVPVPQPGPMEVLVRVTAVGICASDVKMYLGGPFYWDPKTGRAKPPVIPGHEFVGDVAALGEGAAEAFGLKIGDPVVCEQIYACHECWFCRHELPNKCDKLRIYGQALDGACADFMVYRKGSYVYKCPDGMPPYRGVLVEPVAVSVHAMDRAKLEDGMTVLIAGAGPIGLGVVAAIRMYLPSITIIVVDPSGFKLEVAKKMGAHHVYDLSRLSTQDVLADIVANVVTDGRGGPDVYFECTGNPASIPQGLSLVRKCGTFVHVGICKHPECSADWNIISAGKELTVIGTNLGYGCWDRAFDIVESGAMDHLVTHAYSLENYVAALELVSDPVDCIKVVIDPAVEKSGMTEVGRRVVPREMWDGAGRKGKANGEAKAKEAGKAAAADPRGRKDSFDLKGKNVLITGASAGIGEACAKGGCPRHSAHDAADPPAQSLRPRGRTSSCARAGWRSWKRSERSSSRRTPGSRCTPSSWTSGTRPPSTRPSPPSPPPSPPSTCSSTTPASPSASTRSRASPRTWWTP